MRVWKIDTIHGQFAVDSVVRGDRAYVSLRRPEVCGGARSSFVPMKRAYRRIQWIIAAVVKRLHDTGLAG